ncbi:MAG: CRISPR-associated protein Csx19 [Desulfatiglandales bacterium]
MDKLIIAHCDFEDAGSLSEDWMNLFIEAEPESYVMVHDATAHRFDSLKNLRDEVLRKPPWDRGVIFSSTRELRWRRRFGRWHAVLLSEVNGIPEPFKCREVELIEDPQKDNPTEDTLLLWGVSEKTAADTLVLREDRIPLIELVYPLRPEKERQRIGFKCKSYAVHDPETGEETTLYRLWGLCLV